MSAALSPPLEHFLCSYDDVLDRIDAIDPRAYDRSRNHLDGAVTWLGPFLTHGIISTRTVADRVLAQHPPRACYRLLFELAWREYFHREWQLRGDGIFSDIRAAQEGVVDDRPPAALLEAATGIDVIDHCIERLIDEGTLHNHARMWIACIACNLTRTGWWEPARWLHYHLLDGDLASNTLSWQWIAGTFSNKRYLANQDNINKYSGSRQRDTWLDVSYEEAASLPVPEHLQRRRSPALLSQTSWSGLAELPADRVSGDVLLRSVWDLDPTAAAGRQASFVFIDEAQDQQWPMSPNRWRFIRHWAALCDAPLVGGSLDDLRKRLADTRTRRREYPACQAWPGELVERDWLYSLPSGSFRSFSAFWKQVRADVGL